MLSGVVLPMLRDAAGLRVDVHVTEGKAHASFIVRDLDLSDVSRCLVAESDVDPASQLGCQALGGVRL